VNLFSNIKFDKKAMTFFDQISEIVFKRRENEYKEKNKLISKNIHELETKKRHISENIQNILNYPDLLESQNEELQKIKQKIIKLQTLIVNN